MGGVTWPPLSPPSLLLLPQHTQSMVRSTRQMWQTPGHICCNNLWISSDFLLCLVDSELDKSQTQATLLWDQGWILFLMSQTRLWQRITVWSFHGNTRLSSHSSSVGGNSYRNSGCIWTAMTLSTINYGTWPFSDSSRLCRVKDSCFPLYINFSDRLNSVSWGPRAWCWACLNRHHGILKNAISLLNKSHKWMHDSLDCKGGLQHHVVAFPHET